MNKRFVTLTEIVIVIALLAASVTSPALAATPWPVDICALTNLRLMEDASVSADDVQPLQDVVVRGVIDKVSKCPIPPSISVAAYGGTASEVEAIDTADPSGQRSRLAATLTSRWTDPLKALKVAGLEGPGALTILLTDRRPIEPGPSEFGPPASLDVYIAELLSIGASRPFVFVGLGPETDQDAEFGPVWQTIESTGLGEFVGAGTSNLLSMTTPGTPSSAPTVVSTASPSTTTWFEQIGTDPAAAVQSVTIRIDAIKWVALSIIGGLSALCLVPWALSRRPRLKRPPVDVVQIQPPDSPSMTIAVPLNSRAQVRLPEGVIDVDTTGPQPVIRSGGFAQTVRPGAVVTEASGARLRILRAGDSLGAPWPEQTEPAKPALDLTELFWS